MKGVWGILMVLCALASTPAWAGAVYRCESPDGTRSYVSKRVPGAKCVVAGQYKGSERRAAAAPVAAGSATPPTKAVAGSPAAINASAPVLEAAPDEAQPQATATGNGKRLVQGQVYSYIKDGVRHYTSRPPKGVAGATAVRTIKYRYMETCYACGALPGVNFGTIRLNTEAYRNEIAAAAAQFGVEEAIVRAVIHAESAYRPNAMSRVGAQGLMQLMPGTARRFGVANAFDPAQNIRGGVQYLGWLLKRFNGNLTLAAAGYNAGEGAVDKYKGVPPYAETQRYVQRVAVLAERYRGATTVAGAPATAAGSR
ncbi:MAG TPA: lytic transglycosylase domain-containing protein [Lysobacter sp.]|nr:lytic transglycosylase domain-containing protein [Lysobacter sp.]